MTSLRGRQRSRYAATVAIVGLGLLAGPSTVSFAAAPETPWGECAGPLTVAPGVKLTCDPNVLSGSGGGANVLAHIATVDLTAASVVPSVVLSNDRVYQTLGSTLPLANETVSSMADRTSAILGVNGGFFDNDKGPRSAKDDNPEPYSGQICSGFVTGGRIVKSPSSNPALNVSLNVHADGHLSIGPVGFTGSIAVAGASIPLDGVNALDVAASQPSCPKALLPGPIAASGVTLITPDMGEVKLEDSSDDANSHYAIEDAVLVMGHAEPSAGENAYLVDTVTRSALLATIPQLLPGQIGLLSSSTTAVDADAAWLLQHLSAGTHFSVEAQLSDPTITALISGPAPLVMNSAPTDLSGYYAPTPGTRHAETMVGLDATGRAVTLVVVDEYPQWSAGVTPVEAQQIMMNAGADSAILFDGGGSSTLVARQPSTGESTLPADASPANACAEGVSVITRQTGSANYPNGCENQRYVGDGLFFLPATPVPVVTPDPEPSSPSLAATGSTDFAGSRAVAVMFVGIGALMLFALYARRRRSS